VTFQAGTVIADDVEVACCVNHFTCDEAILKDIMAKLLE
jgi:hypothetical protein